jgi:hypothetical protein
VTEHGTAACARDGCVDPACLKALAAAEYAREYRKYGARGRRTTRKPLGPDDLDRNGRRFGNRTHGKIGSYVAGCGCEECRAVGAHERARFSR